MAWNSVLPELLTNHYLYFEDWNGDGREELVGANAFALRGFSRTEQAWLPFWADLGHAAVYSNSGVTDNVVLHGHVDGERRVLFLRGGEFSVMSSENLSGEISVLGEYVQSELELAKPYEAYDQLRVVDDNGCAGLALGVGLFPSSPRFPRRLVSLNFASDGSYSANGISTVHPSVISLATGRSSDGRIAGVVSRGDGAHAFELFVERDCTWVRAAGPLELDFHPICSQTSDGGESCAGERLVLAGGGERLEFLHLGDFWLDVVTAVQSEGRWLLHGTAWRL